MALSQGEDAPVVHTDVVKRPYVHRAVTRRRAISHRRIADEGCWHRGDITIRAAMARQRGRGKKFSNPRGK